MSRSLVLVFVAVLFGCAEAEREPAPPAPPPASGRSATLADWLPPGAAGSANAVPGHATPPPGAPHAAAPAAGSAPAPGGQLVQGRVTETMNSGGYTYMHVETPSGLIWVASVQREVAVGATVQARGMVMQGFRSNTLNRTFDRLVLATTVEVTAAAEGAAAEGAAAEGAEGAAAEGAAETE